MIRNIIILVLYVMIVGCKSEGKVENTRIYIQLIRDSIDFEMDFNLINHIFLETTDESIYLDAKKMHIVDSSIYLLDGDVNNRKLLYFKTSGKFVRRTNRGKGPGEFLYLSDFFFDKTSDHFLALALMRNKLVELDRNLNLIEEHTISTGEVVDHFAKLDNGHWIVNKPYADRPPIGDFYYFGISQSHEFKDIFRYDFELPYSLKYYHLRDPISRHYDETIKVSIPMDMNIYEVSQDSFSVAYRFNFGEFGLPKNLYRGKSNEEFFSILNSSEYVSGINKVIEISEYLAFEFVWKQQIEYLILNRKTAKYLTSIELEDAGVLPDGELMTIDSDGHFVIKSNPEIFNLWYKESKPFDPLPRAKNYGSDVLTVFRLDI